MTSTHTYTYMPLAAVRAAKPEAATRGVSGVARSRRGFVAAYTRAHDEAGLPERWCAERRGFIARHVAQAKANGEPWWKDGEPTRRHLALMMWAYTPTPARTKRWIATLGADDG